LICSIGFLVVVVILLCSIRFKKKIKGT
jgi:hypothetical protein